MKIPPLLLALSLLFRMIPLPAAAVEESPILETVPAEEAILMAELPLAEDLPTEEALPADPISPEPLALSEASNPGPGLYFGQLHAHSALSGGFGTPEEAYCYAAEVADLDFFALTDHSDSFDNALSGCIDEDAAVVSEKWAAGKAAAAAATTENFVGIYGYEMSWPRQKQLGHISTFATPGFQSWDQDAFTSSSQGLTHYYEALASVPGSISQFNHPGTQYGTFTDFAHYSEAADQVITLLEVGSGEGQVGGPGYFSAYDLYTRALDKGWHLAPTNNQANHQGAWGTANTARTAVFAESLTEEGIYNALRAYRTYATEDSDLQIHYSLDGFFLGSRLKLRQLGDAADISVSLCDPTDDAIGLVEVIVEGGETAASRTVDTSSADLSFSLSANHPYYYLKITQPDGDTAVTAPIWVEQTESLGIAGLTCETAVPIQGEAARLSLTLSNGEDADFLIDRITVLRDGVIIAEDTSLSRLPAQSRATHALTVSHENPGSAQFTVRICGTLEGSARQFEAAISLFFQQSASVRDILVDGTHGNEGIDDLTRLIALAAEDSLRVTVVRDAITPEMLENCGLLLIPPPEQPFSVNFLSLVKNYAAYGGSVLVCGRADSRDSGVSSGAHLNRLLRSLGSTMTLRDDQARDTVHNGGTDSLLFTSAINTDAPWCAYISENQVYRQALGCTVDPGSGTWLVKGLATTGSFDGDGDGSGGSELGNAVFLAAEALSGGGNVFVAGSLFLDDAGLEAPETLWAEPYANRTITRNLLGMEERELPLSTIRQARDAEPGTLLRVRGHVTAGTANSHTTFPDTLYLQDETGGIAVIPFSTQGISIGTAIEIIGTAGTDGFDPILTYGDHMLPDDGSYRYLPKTGDFPTLLDLSLSGGELIQLEGTASDLLFHPEGTLSGFALTDPNGNCARILVENSIASSATGKNTLHEFVLEGRTIRAIGILCTDTSGDPVVRVRNCEEVVYIPPAVTPSETAPAETIPSETVPAETTPSETYTNPKTGDPVFWCLPGLISGFSLLLCRKKR